MKTLRPVPGERTSGRPIFRKSFGHQDFTWGSADMAEALQRDIAATVFPVFKAPEERNNNA